MFRWSFLPPRFHLLGAILLAMPVLALAPAPSQEFWDYVEEYGDASGNVLDPLEYDQIMNIKNDEKLALKETPSENEQPSIVKAIDKTQVINADMKSEKKSSSASSSASTRTISGAKL